MSLAVAEAIVKTALPIMPTVSGHLRPASSDQGAQITGPKAKPSTYNAVPSVPTSELTPKSLLALLVPGAKTALLNEVVKVPKQATNEMYSLLLDQHPENIHQTLWASRLTLSEESSCKDGQGHRDRQSRRCNL